MSFNEEAIGISYSYPESQDETHLIASEDPNIHLAKGYVRANSKWI